MAPCPHCHSANPAGSLFCVACAMPLVQPMARPVAAAPGPAMAVPPGPPAMPAAPAVPARPAAAGAKQAVRLVETLNMQPTGRELTLPDTSWAGTLYLGRPDLAAGVVVDLDLSALDGHAKRVSRKHAKLHFVTRAAGGPNEVRLEDWGSAHGTWLNKARLPQGASEPLQDGDEIRLAELVFTVRMT